MELILSNVLLGLKFLQVPVLALLVYICYQIFDLNNKPHYSLIFKGWLFNLIHILLLIPIAYPLLFQFELIIELALRNLSKLSDLIGGLLLLLAVRDHVSKSDWKLVRFIPPATKRKQLYIGFSIAFIFCFLFYANKYYYEYKFVSSNFSPLLLIPSAYVLSTSYFTLCKYYKTYIQEKLHNRTKFLFYGALIYAVIQFLPPIFELVVNYIDKNILDIVGYTLGLTSKVFIIIGLHAYLIPELPDNKKIAEKLSKKKDLVSEAFHEIEGMGDLIQISLDELTDPENESKYFLTKKTLNILSTIEANNLRNVDILSSYRRLVGNLITGDYEKDTEKVLIDDVNITEDVNVNVIINMVSAIVKSKFKGKGVKINKELGLGNENKIKCRQFELYQIIKVILVNAFEACPKQGKIWVKTFTSREDSQKKINITIADNGCGISDESMEKIFSSEYSTKPLQKETWRRGHGLPTALKLCKKYGFEIKASSQLNPDFLRKKKVTEFLISINT